MAQETPDASERYRQEITALRDEDGINITPQATFTRILIEEAAVSTQEALRLFSENVKLHFIGRAAFLLGVFDIPQYNGYTGEALEENVDGIVSWLRQRIYLATQKLTGKEVETLSEGIPASGTLNGLRAAIGVACDNLGIKLEDLPVEIRTSPVPYLLERIREASDMRREAPLPEDQQKLVDLMRIAHEAGEMSDEDLDDGIRGVGMLAAMKRRKK